MRASKWISSDWTDEERHQIAQTLERAHDAGEMSGRDFAYARIQGAIARWHMEAWEASGRPEPVPDDITNGRAPITSVGIPAIDTALPHTTKPAHVFLNAVAYLLKESDDALEIAAGRAKACDEAAKLLRKVDALLRSARNPSLAKAAAALEPWAAKAKFGTVFPVSLSGNVLLAEFRPDALSASLAGKRGTQSRSGAVVRALIPLLPNTAEFYSGGGYSLIAELAELCGAIASPAYVRSVIEQTRRTAPMAAPAARVTGPDRHLMRLFSNP